MRLLFTFVLLLAINAHAEAAPQPPDNPQSYRDCNEYNRQLWDYVLGEMRESINQCRRQHEHDPGYYHSDVDTRCSPLGWPKACAHLIEESDCAVEESYVHMRNCRNKVAALLESQRKIDISQDTLSNKLMLTTATGVPKVAEANAKRLSFTLADTPPAAPANSLLEKLKYVNTYYSRLQKSLVALDPKSSPQDKVSSGARLLAQMILKNPELGGNLIAQDMLDISIGGLVATNTAALEKLQNDLQAISLDLGKSNQNEIASAYKATQATAQNRIDTRHQAEVARAAENARVAEENRLAAERSARAEQEATELAASVEQERAQAAIYDQEARARADEFNGDGGHPNWQQAAYRTCTKSYNETFRDLPSHRALVAGVSKTSSRCNWTSGYDSQAEAIEAAIQNCRKQFKYCIIYGTDTGTTAWSRMVSDNNGNVPGYVRNGNAYNDAYHSNNNAIMLQQFMNGMVGAMGSRRSGTSGGYDPYARPTKKKGWYDGTQY